MKGLLLLLCLLPALASAGTLYRCVSPNGQVSYLATSCGAGQRMDRSIEFAPESDSKPLATNSRQQRSTAVGSRRGVGHLPGGSVAKKSKPDPCQQARTKRDLQLERLGLKRTFADLSRLDATVRKACRGY